jgi:diacylglycerol O-acyltransferase / trehalose O-mycolyltransferase
MREASTAIAAIATIAVAVLVAPGAAAQTVVPDYVPVAADATPAVTSATELSGGMLLLQVASPAMRREVPVKVLPAADRSRPHGVYYLLDGNSGQVDDNNWLDPARGDAAAFFADKDVNVVFPIGGTGSMYTDWVQDHPKFGRAQWESFLSKELPPLIDARFGTNGRNAIGGISMGATAAMMLAERAPEVYDGAVGYSGCYLTEGPAGKALTDLVVINGNGTSDQMWGPPGSETWRSHDVFLGAPRLAGKPVYLSSGSGLPGPHENPNAPGFAQSVVVGGVMEFAVSLCTDQLAQTLREAGAHVTRGASPVGLHAWPYWRDELGRSWPTIRAATGG